MLEISRWRPLSFSTTTACTLLAISALFSGTWTIGCHYPPLFTGQTAIAGEYSKGWNLYFPIPYAKSCKVTSDKGGFYYHVNYRTYPADTKIVSFAAEQLTALDAQLKDLAAKLAAPGDLNAPPAGASATASPRTAASGPKPNTRASRASAARFPPSPSTTVSRVRARNAANIA